MGDFYMPPIKRLPLTIFEIHTFEIISLTLILHYFLIYSSQARLSMSIMHHWRGVAMKISLLRGTGLFWPSVSDPLMTVCLGSSSSLWSNADRLCRSDTGSSDTLNNLPVEKGCWITSGPLKLLTRECPEADVRSVTTSPICSPFQTCSENLNMEIEKNQLMAISFWE